MIQLLRRTLPALLVLSAATSQAQYLKAHGASLSVGGTGQFSTLLESNSGYVSNSYNFGNGIHTDQTFQQQQFTTWSAGFVTSLQIHPVSWAGIALNYGFNHYQERFQYNLTDSATPGQTRVPTDVHEFTGGYLFHPKRIPFQPYVEVGGGAIDFTPSTTSNQIRGAGLLETGFDLAPKNSHIGFRISGRSLYYRSPNFYQPAISTRSWRVTEEPAISAFYRF
ncbi:MAG: hypothetical protein ACRYFU_13965 [Janthinobacterium lividum]